MKEIQGTSISSLPFGEMSLVSELLSFEGTPVLLHFGTSHSDVLAYWIDYNDTAVRWLYKRVSKSELIDYLSGRISLKRTLSFQLNDFAFINDIDTDDRALATWLIDAILIPEEYFPEDDSFFIEGISEQYQEYFKSVQTLGSNYIYELRDQSYTLTVEPATKTHEQTVSAKDAALVLNNASNSVEAYIRAKAFRVYSEKIGDVSVINKRSKKIVDLFTPRVAEVAYGSFKVWLAIDLLTFNDGDSLDNEIKSGLIDGYKRDVLDVDYSSAEDARIITEKFTAPERKKIFEPLIRLLDNGDFTVKISDKNDTIKPKTFNGELKVSNDFINIIIPKPSKEELEAELQRKNKMVSIVLNLKEGDDITKFTKKQLLDKVVNDQEIFETPYRIKSPIVSDGHIMELSQPLLCSLRIDEDGNLELYNYEMGLSATGTDVNEVSNEIKKQFFNLVTTYLQNPERSDSKVFELKKYFITPSN